MLSEEAQKDVAAKAQLFRDAADWIEAHPEYAPFLLSISQETSTAPRLKAYLYGFSEGLTQLLPWEDATISNMQASGYGDVCWVVDGMLLSCHAKPPATVAKARRIEQLLSELDTLQKEGFLAVR